MGKSKPGPNVNTTRERIANEIRNSDKRAITAPEIADAAELTVKTVYKHVDAVVEQNRDIHSSEIGGSTAYWSDPPTPESSTSVGSGRPPDTGGPALETTERDTTPKNRMAIPGVQIPLYLVYLALLAPLVIADGSLFEKIASSAGSVRGRLKGAYQAHSSAPDTLRYPRLGSPVGIWAMAALCLMLGLIVATALQAAIGTIGPPVVSIVIGGLVAVSLAGFLMIWNASPSTQHSPTEA